MIVSFYVIFKRFNFMQKKKLNLMIYTMSVNQKIIIKTNRYRFRNAENASSSPQTIKTTAFAVYPSEFDIWFQSLNYVSNVTNVPNLKLVHVLRANTCHNSKLQLLNQNTRKLFLKFRIIGSEISRGTMQNN